MAHLVEILCVNHSPTLPRRLNAPSTHPGIERIKRRWHEMAERLAASRPDVVLMVASDHLHQWFMDNMPAFLIGKAPAVTGPFPFEVRDWGLPRYDAPSHPGFAQALLEGGLKNGIDFAFSNEFVLDHAFTVPLCLLRPQADIPVVPLFTNVMAPPLPSAARYHQVGTTLRGVIDALPLDLRVCVVFSGHLSIEIGGPHMKASFVDGGSQDPEFDERMTELIATGDATTLVREATFERMSRAGNIGGTGFLPFVMAVGLAQNRRPALAEAIPTNMSTQPFYVWDLHLAAAATS